MSLTVCYDGHDEICYDSTHHEGCPGCELAKNLAEAVFEKGDLEIDLRGEISRLEQDVADYSKEVSALEEKLGIYTERKETERAEELNEQLLT